LAIVRLFMTGKSFVDTNVLVYAHDQEGAWKRERALQCLGELWESGGGRLSTQGLQEFVVNITQKNKQPIGPERSARSNTNLRLLGGVCNHAGNRHSSIRNRRNMADFVLGRHDSGSGRAGRSHGIVERRHQPRAEGRRREGPQSVS